MLGVLGLATDGGSVDLRPNVMRSLGGSKDQYVSLATNVMLWVETIIPRVAPDGRDRWRARVNQLFRFRHQFAQDAII